MSMMDASCRKCGKRFGWQGILTDRPPCPECGDTIPMADLEREQLKLAHTLQHMAEAGNAATEEPRRGVVCKCGNPLISTFVFSGAEFFCCECKTMVPFRNATRVDDPAPELIAKHANDLAWFRSIAVKYVPRGGRFGNCARCEGGEDHVEHATDVELKESAEARRLLLETKP